MVAQKSIDPLELLSLFRSGILTITVDGLPLVKISADSKSVDLEGKNVKECGVPLSRIIDLETNKKGLMGLLIGSRTAAKRLTEKGWRMTLFDKGSKLVTLGKGASGLTGHINLDPTKARKILRTL